MRKLGPDDLMRDLESFLEAAKGKSGVDQTAKKALEWWPELRGHPSLYVELWAWFLREEATRTTDAALCQRLQRLSAQLVDSGLRREQPRAK